MIITIIMYTLHLTIMYTPYSYMVTNRFAPKTNSYTLQSETCTNISTHDLPCLMIIVINHRVSAILE